MAALRVHNYVDQENVSATNPKGRSSTSGRPVGKSFLSNNQQTAVTQRKALGILNTGNSNVRGPVGKSNNVVLKQPQSTLKKPVVTIKNHSQTKLTASNTQKPKREIEKQKPEVEPGIPSSVSSMFVDTDEPELMHIYEDPDSEDDDFEDVWPKSERLSTYIDKLKSIRPGRLFHCYPQDEEDAERPPPDTIKCDDRPESDDVCIEIEEAIPTEEPILPSVEELIMIDLNNLALL